MIRDLLLTCASVSSAIAGPNGDGAPPKGRRSEGKLEKDLRRMVVATEANEAGAAKRELLVESLRKENISLQKRIKRFEVCICHPFPLMGVQWSVLVAADTRGAGGAEDDQALRVVSMHIFLLAVCAAVMTIKAHMTAAVRQDLMVQYGSLIFCVCVRACSASHISQEKVGLASEGTKCVLALEMELKMLLLHHKNSKFDVDPLCEFVRVQREHSRN